MSLIEKEYALEKAENQYYLNVINEQTKNEIIKFIKSLPSAQPKHDENPCTEQGESDKLGLKTGKTCTDCISRQAAIDAIKTWGLLDGLSEGQAIEILADAEKLPSTQPEVTEEAVKDYCRKRCLTILTNDCFYKLTSAQPECEHTMEEFMYGQDMGDPEDGSL